MEDAPWTKLPIRFSAHALVRVRERFDEGKDWPPPKLAAEVGDSIRAGRIGKSVRGFAYGRRVRSRYRDSRFVYSECRSRLYVIVRGPEKIRVVTVYAKH